jgi:S1-C subfamily serine protease
VCRAASLDTPAGLQDAYHDARGRVVGITYTLKAMESEPGVEGPKADGVLCGVVVDASGLILTVGDIFPEPGGDPRQTFSPTDFKVHYGDGKTAPATAVGIDRGLNLAYLRMAAESADELRPAKFRDNPPLEVGDPVIVIGVLGRKYGFAPAIFRTTINAAVQGKIPLFGVDALLQDLALGGLVLRRDGSAAGIVAKDLIAEDLDDNRSPGNILSILANMGQPQVRRPGYAMILPFSAFSSSLASPPPMDLAADVKRAWIGIVMQALSSDLRDYWKLPVTGGIIVGSVVEGSPAQEAGIRPGDVITAFDGDPLRIAEDAQLSDFRRKVEVMGVGRETDVQVYRDRTPLTVRMKLGEAPKTASRADEYEDEEFGVTVREITIDTQQALNLDPNFRGVVVAETEESGWADIGGLVPDDVILSVNGGKVSSVEEVRSSFQEIRKARAPEAVFFVMRPPDTLFVRVKTDFKERLRDGPEGGLD